MNFQDLEIKKEYRSLLDNIARDFYLPLLSKATLYQRAVGFFSSSVLIEISKGIATLAQNGGHIQLVASPYLSDDDIIAIKNGYELRDQVVKSAVLRELHTPVTKFDSARLNLLANLIADGVLDIKIAFTEDEDKMGMYHEKMGIITDVDGNRVAFSGSMNESATAMTLNYETIDVYCSWKGEEERVNVVLSKNESTDENTALGFAKRAYPNIFGHPQNMSSLEDNSIRFIEPFINRDSELKYVIKDISNRIRKNYNGELGSITSFLSNIAIIVAINKESYEQRISDLFSEIGVFVLKENTPMEIAKETLPKVCFTKTEFMALSIKNINGNDLLLNEKIKAFQRCYHKIEINMHKRPISTYPIGQFVLRIYEIVTEGMSLEAFKCIMFSNWRYSLNVTNQKWSNFISQFKLLETWFENHTDIATWKKIAKNLLDLKSKLTDNPLYCYHPLNVVSLDSLQVLADLISELENIVNIIKHTNGSISDHISVLKNVVINYKDFIPTDNLDQEQQIAQRLINTIMTLKDTTVIGDVSVSYFAENIRSMLMEYESETFDEMSPLSLAVVNLENMRTYKTCYFIMCEAGKYPRPYIEKFPYTTDMCEILSKEKYGINAVPSNRFGLKYHLNLERYLLKNVLDFVSDELIITHTEKESGVGNTISLFAKNLAVLFNTEIPFETNKQEEYEEKVYNQNEMNPLFFPRKDNYTIY